MKTKKAFTLIELLLVIAIIGILAAIVIIAINPGRQLAQSRNAQRRTDVNTVINAVYQYSIDNNGTLPGSIPSTATEICATDATSCLGLVDLGDLTDNETYITAVPEDPQATGDGAGYEILQSSNGRITVSAPDSELGENIEVTR